MVRSLGPRSVSSILKISLEVAFVLVAVFLLLLGVFTLLSAVAMIEPSFLSSWRHPSGETVLAETPQQAAPVLLVCLFALGLLGIIAQLRKIFISLIKGSPFIMQNARRLRMIGLIIAGLEAVRFGGHALVVWVLHATPTSPPPQLNFSVLFAIAALFVLAEVFEEGVRMKKDLELTI